MRENIVTHYLPLRFGQDNTMHEKGIDVWLALEAYEMALYKKFDIVALVVSDGDYVPLVRKLATVGVHVMLISWDFDYYNEDGNVEQTRTSQQLIEEVYHPVPMYRIVEQFPHDDLVKNLFVQDREYYYSIGSAVGEQRGPGQAGASRQTVDQQPAAGRPAGALPATTTAGPGIAATIRPPAPSPEAEFESVILSVSERGFGFIEAPEINNVFFFYNSVVNADFNTLAAGTRVRYTRVEDPEKSKIDGQPRYRAGKVFVVDDGMPEDTEDEVEA
jgi:cold shock CspA family protein